jgi:acetyl esterase/lipase
MRIPFLFLIKQIQMKFKSIFLISFLIGLTILFSSCKKFEEIQESKLDARKKQILYNMSYGEHNRNKLDIALPKNRTVNTPVVIFIHGGAWVAGDKNVFLTEIEQFALEGIACATINYRFASDLLNIHHPDLPEDIRKAVDYIASKSEKWQVSPSSFGLVGHSAGGHLSLITTYIFNNDNIIKACASWAGPVNFIDPAQLSINGAKDILKTYTGRVLNTPTDTMIYKEASPYWTATASSVPTYLIYATNDDLVPYSTAVSFEQQLNSLGVTNSFLTFQNEDHIWTGNNLTQARNRTLQWFKERL